MNVQPHNSVTMKNKTLWISTSAFISGIILGISAISLLSFTPAPVKPVSLPAISKISLSQAKTYFNSYYNNAQPLNAIFKGFTIGSEQLQALDQLAAENPGLSRFRIYLGKDETSAQIGIVVGVDANGQDLSSGSIYRSAAVTSGPCPPICDATSQITTR